MSPTFAATRVPVPVSKYLRTTGRSVCNQSCYIYCCFQVIIVVAAAVCQKSPAIIVVCYVGGLHCHRQPVTVYQPINTQNTHTHTHTHTRKHTRTHSESSFTSPYGSFVVVIIIVRHHRHHHPTRLFVILLLL
jgi:hypothetical protein